MRKDLVVKDDNVLSESIVEIVNATIGKSLQSVIQKYTGVFDEIANELQSFRKQVSQIEEIQHISGFLFESYNVTSKLMELLEENIQAVDEGFIGSGFEEMKRQLYDKLEIARLVDLRENINKASGNQGEKPFLSETVVSFGKKRKEFLKRFLKKKKSDENLPSNFILVEVVLYALHQHEGALEELCAHISDLLMAVWGMSRAVTAKVDSFLDIDYDYDERQEFIFEEFDIEGCKAYLDKMSSTSENYLKRFTGTITHRIGEVGDQAESVHELKRKERKKYRSSVVFKGLDKSIQKITLSFSNWNNTWFALSEDWKLELEISVLKYHILKHYFDFSHYIRRQFHGKLNENIKQIRANIDELIALFSEEDKKGVKFPDDLDNKRVGYKRKLALRIIPEVRKIILDSNIPNRIDDFELSTLRQFKQLSKNRVILKNPEYDKPTPPSSNENISPFSLVSFEMMPEFMVAFPTLKQAFIRHLQQVQNRFEEIPDIIDFSLLSAINFYDERKDPLEASKIGQEGIKRAQNKLSDIVGTLDDFNVKEIENLRKRFEKLTKDLYEITNNESALQIRMRITRAMAVEKSRAVRNKIFSYIRNILPKLIEIIRSAFDFIRASSDKIRKQFLVEDKKQYIATDISDYLAETEKAINRLPFIYQRLFKPEPLTSTELYIERAMEFETLKTAYNRWKEGKFAPTVIIAERGWGKTTLLNRFKRIKSITEQFVYLKPDPGQDPETFFRDILKVVPLEVHEEKKESYSQSGKIVMVNGLEKLFEVRINGFDFLTKILKHISDTNHNVFWLTTCNLYAWQYLEKVVSISDYFGYHIKLADLTDQKLNEIIDRRHSISGYRLVFLPETQKKSLISFKKQTDLGDQDELREQYFTRMQRVVKGNLSQAFLFWMRSAAQVTEDTVFIEYLSGEYFNFLSSLSDARLMILKNVVLHNGISAEKHASLYRIPEDKSNLLLGQLYDDGILVRTGPVYNINPIIYRQVIDQLVLLNILH